MHSATQTKGFINLVFIFAHEAKSQNARVPATAVNKYRNKMK